MSIAKFGFSANEPKQNAWHVVPKSRRVSALRCASGMAPAEQVKTLEKLWAAYRKQNGLALHGKAAEPGEAGAPACDHSSAPG